MNGLAYVQLQVDTAVRDAAEYVAGDLPDEIVVRGCGGTDFRPGFAWLEEQDIRAGVCLYLTDMECARYPEAAPAFDVLWCNWGQPPSDWNREPWGDRIDMAATGSATRVTRRDYGAPTACSRRRAVSTRLTAMQSMLNFASVTRTEDSMASITIRNLDEGVKRRLRVRAAENGRSMEEEARDVLRRAVGEAPPPKDLGRAIHARFAALGGVDLDLTERGPMRPPPKFG